jgi:hypothetical protein
LKVRSETSTLVGVFGKRIVPVHAHTNVTTAREMKGYADSGSVPVRSLLLPHIAPLGANVRLLVPGERQARPFAMLHNWVAAAVTGTIHDLPKSNGSIVYARERGCAARPIDAGNGRYSVEAKPMSELHRRGQEALGALRFLYAKQMVV